VLHMEISAAAAASETGQRRAVCGLRLRLRAVLHCMGTHAKGEDAWLYPVVEVGRNLQVKTAAEEARKQYLKARPTEAISKRCTAAAADAVREEARFLDRVPRPVMT
jgi:hypothetical protein